MFLINLKAMESPRTPQPDEIPTLKEALATALENRPEIRQAMLDLKNKDIDVQYSKNQTKPSLDVSANFSQNGTGGTQRILGNALGGVPDEVRPGGVADALRQMWGFNYTGYNVGFTLVIPLDNKAAKADFSRSVNERKLSDARLEATTQGIALEVRNAITQAEVASASESIRHARRWIWRSRRLPPRKPSLMPVLQFCNSFSRGSAMSRPMRRRRFRPKSITPRRLSISTAQWE